MVAENDNRGGPLGEAPVFSHRDRVQRAMGVLFEVFQLPDIRLRRALFASLLVENSIILLSGTFGTGKTQLVQLVKKLLFSDGSGGYDYDYETCNQELTAFDVLYHLDLAELQRGKEVVHPKRMVTARLKFLNEIQRASIGFFNAMLPLFSEHCVTYRDFEIAVPGFVCIMDRNPLDAGSSEIPEAFLDRVDFSFDIAAVHLEEILRLQELRRRRDGYHWGGLEAMVEPAMTITELQEAWRDVRRVAIPRRPTLLAGMLSDAVRLCIATERSNARPDFDLDCLNCQFHGEICSHLLKVPGLRITNSTFRLAQALAWLDGLHAVREDDVVAAFPWCLPHRLSIRFEELRKRPSEQNWVLEVALGEILQPKVPFWARAIDMLESGNVAELRALGENDLVVRELQLLALAPAAVRGQLATGGLRESRP